jgi:hypothetical protein
LAAFRVPEAAAGPLDDGAEEVVVGALEGAAALELGASAGGAVLVLEPQALSPVSAAATETTVRVARAVLIRWLLGKGSCTVIPMVNGQ